MKVRLTTALAALLLCLLLGGAAVAEYATVYNTDSLNLRADASSSSTWLGKYARGTWVNILGSRNNFYQVSTPDGAVGYMSKNYLYVLSMDCAAVATVQNQRESAFLNLRSSPSYDARVITILYNGVPLLVTNQYDNGWIQVRLGDTIGYVRGEYVSISYLPASPVIATIKTPNNSSVNMRAEPSKNASVLRTFRGDRYVMVLGEGNGWWYVSIDAYTGFISSDFLVKGLHAARDEREPVGDAYAVVANPRSSAWLNLRVQPSTSSRAIGQLYNGNRLTVQAQGTEWCSVYADALGASGYVMTRYLTLHNLPTTPTREVTHPQGSFVNLRSAATMTASVVRRIPSGKVATVIVPGADWTKISYDGSTGYVMTYFLR